MGYGVGSSVAIGIRSATNKATRLVSCIRAFNFSVMTFQFAGLGCRAGGSRQKIGRAQQAGELC